MANTQSNADIANLFAMIMGFGLLVLPLKSAAQQRPVKNPLCVPCLFGIGLNAFDKSQRQIQAAARQRETETLRLRIAKRRPNEATAAFLQRVLPVSYPAAYGDNNAVVQYSWRPRAFGEQLFFSVLCNGGEKWAIENNGGSDLFVLDPFQPNTYAVQILRLETMGDLTTVASIFFADVDQDGQKELLVLMKVSLKEMDVDKHGERMFFHADRYATSIFRYKASVPASCLQYQQDLTPRPYLDDLPTATAVRQALAHHQRKPKSVKR